MKKNSSPHLTAAGEYRQLAEECFRRASAAKTDAERKAFLDMARHWTEAAARQECGPFGLCALRR